MYCLDLALFEIGFVVASAWDVVLVPKCLELLEIWFRTGFVP